MNVVDLTAQMLMDADPSITREEAMQMAREQHAPQSRTDGAPANDMGVDPQLDYPEQKYKYNPVSREWEDTAKAQADQAAMEQSQAQRSGKFGSAWGGQQNFASPEEAAAYSARPASGPSQRDLDMLETSDVRPEGTGWVEVYDEETGTTHLMQRAPAPEVEFGGKAGPTLGGVPIAQAEGYRQPDWDAPGQDLAGWQYMRDVNRGLSVDDPLPGYMEGRDWGGVEQGWANTATGNQRSGGVVDNRDVRGQMPDRLRGGRPGNRRPEYDRVPTLRQGPNGPVWVYDYDPATKSTRDANAKQTRDELQLKRMAKQAGISMAEARRLKEEGGGSVQGIRDLIFDRNNEDQRAREQAVRSRNMLAGNDPRANLTNAYNTLSPEDQRAAMLGMMFPQGATPLDVEQAAAAAVRETPLELMMRQRELDLMERQARQAEDAANPAAAGARHLSEGQYDTPEAMQELDRLTLQFDTTYGGYSVENERRLAAALQAPPYNIPQAEAERIAYEQAESRRWGSGSPPGEQPPPAPASAGPAAWGGAAG